MGAPTTKLVSRGGAGGSAAYPTRDDIASPSSGGQQNQGGRVAGLTAAGGNVPLKWNVVQITGPASYTTGGDAPNWNSVGFASNSDVIAVIPLGPVAGSVGKVMEYDHANNKLKIMVSNGAAVLAEVANGSDQSAAVWYAMVVGT